MQELVSIIIPVYNLEEYLPQCLDSMLAQTYENIEILLIDDGSADRSGEICDAYAKKDTRFIVLHKENEGVSKARNDALDRMKGEYCIFVDGDDWLSEDFVEELYHQCQEDGADMVFANQRLSRDDGSCRNMLYSYSHKQILNRQEALMDVLTNSGTTAGKLYKKEIIGAHRYPVGFKLAEDEMMQLQIFLGINKISYNATPIYYRRERTGSASRRGFREADAESLKLRERMAQMLLKGEPGLKRYVYSFMTGRYAMVLLKALQSDRKAEAKAILKRYRYWCRKRRAIEAGGLVLNIKYCLLAAFPRTYVFLKKTLQK